MITEEQFSEMKARMERNAANPAAAEKAQSSVRLARVNKYRVSDADQRTVDGIRFDSKKESELYIKLKILAAAGKITQLERQTNFILQDAFDKNGIHYAPIHYRADFTFIEDGKKRVLDAKGAKTAMYALKRKLFEFRYPSLTIEEI